MAISPFRSPAVLAGIRPDAAGTATGTLSAVIGTGAGTVTETPPGVPGCSPVPTLHRRHDGLRRDIKGRQRDGPGRNASTVSVASGAVLDLNGTTMTGTNALTLNGTGISGGGALINSSTTAGTYAGLITLGSASSIVTTSGNITISNAGTIGGGTP